ncbi:MAG: D-glycerate dehydrogenase, partial [Planctomycetaceae bacterium]
SAAEAELGARFATLEDLLSSSDFVTLNCPLTAQTTGLIGERQLALMKPGAFLINVARGPVVDADALYDALASRRIAGAALDVTAPEPLPRGHRLLTLENLVITPHLGSASDRTRRRMIEMTVENLQAGLAGKPLPWQVLPRPTP